MIKLEITSSGEQPSVEDCRRVYLDLKGNLDEGRIEPQRPPATAEHRGIVDTFTTLLLEGINLGFFSAMFQVVKTFLENRPTCEVTLTYPDGFQLKVSKCTLEAARLLHEEHVQRLAALQAQSS